MTFGAACEFLFGRTEMILHLLMFNLIWLSEHHLSTPSVMRCGSVRSQSPRRYAKMSSAYFLSCASSGMYLFISQMQRINKIGPMTLPWMTPCMTSSHSVIVFPVLTLWYLSDRYAASHDISHSGRRFFSFLSSRSWGTRSNAFSKSQNIVTQS